MKNLLTSQDILHAEFKKSLRGYDIKEVDYFLDAIVATLEHYNKKITEMEEMLAKNKEQLSCFEDTRELMQSTLLMAQKSAAAIVKKARTEAEEIITGAQAEAEDIKNGAYDEKSELFKDLQKARQIRETYFAETNNMLTHFREMLDEYRKTNATELQVSEFMKDFIEEKTEKDAETEFKAKNLRFEYEQEQPIVQNKKIIADEVVSEKDNTNENTRQLEKSDEDMFALCDSEELILKDAQAVSSSDREPDLEEIEAQDLARAEKISFADENQSNLFGEEEEPTKLTKQINYAEQDDLDA